MGAFDDVFDSSQGESLFGIVGAREIGKDNDGNVFGLGIGFDFFEDFDTADFGHHDVEENDGGFFFP